MTMENVSPSPTRRNLLAGLAGITVAAVAAHELLHGGDLHPDAELLASIERFASADSRSIDIYLDGLEAIDALSLPHPEEVARKAAAFQALLSSDQAGDLMLHEIASQPARTQDGMAAKARVVQRWIGDGWEIPKAPTTDPWERVAWSLAQDALNAGAMA